MGSDLPKRMGSAGECGVDSTLSFSAWPSFVNEDRISNALPFSSTARVTSTYGSGGGESANASPFSSGRRPSSERGTSRAAAMSRPKGPCTTGALSERLLAPPPPRLDRMALIAL
eukprot:2733440-Pleurochrysis_carterae.AAC.1